MPDDVLQYPVDSTGKKGRTYRRGSLTSDPHDAYVIPTVDRVISGRYFAATFRVPGAAASPLNLLTMHSTAASPLVAIRRISVEVEASAVTAYLVNSVIRLFRSTTVPSGGTAATKQKTDTGDSSSAASVIVTGPASADGTASAITYALPSGTPMAQQSVPKILTGVGQWLSLDDSQELWTPDDPPLVLRNGESILVAVVGNTATHLHFYTNIWWEEYTRP